MSAESAIDSLISTLRSLSTSYCNSAYSLIQAADTSAQTLRTPASDELEYDVDRVAPTFTRVPLPPNLPGVRDLTLPTIDDLQSVSEINDEFTDTAPDLYWPNFSYPSLPTIPEFTGSAPTIPPLTIIPTAPTIESPTIPDQTIPNEVTVDSLGGNPPDFSLPTFTEFSGDFFTEYENGLDALGSEISEWHSYLNSIRDQLLPMETELQQRLRGVLLGTEPGLPDSWETKIYEQAQQEAYNQRIAGIDSLDSATGPMTGLPAGNRDYARLKLELQTLQLLAQSAAKTTDARQKREVQHVRWALEVAIKMADAALNLQAQSAAWRIQGVLLALDGAQSTLDVAIKVLAYKEKELAMLVRYNDAQIRRTEDRVKLEKTKLEKLQFQVANNKLKATYNQHQAEIDGIASAYVESCIKLFESQIDYLLVDQEWRKLNFAAFEAEVYAYQARVKASLSEHAALKARIKGDLARADAELAKAKQYEIEMQVQETTAKALLAQTKTRAERNRQILAAYNSEVETKLRWLQGIDKTIDIAVRAIADGYNAEAQEQMLVMASQELEDQESLDTARRDMEVEQLSLLKTLQIHAVALEQTIAQGRIMTQGAGTLGGIAQTAYAGLNAVGTRELLEEA